MEAAEGETVTDARAYLAKVNETMATITSYQAVMTAEVRTPLGDASVTGRGDFLLKPELRYRNGLDCVLTDASGKQTKFMMTQYIEQAGDTVTAYSGLNGAWNKRTVPFKGGNAAYDVNAYMKMIKSAEIKEQTESEVTLAVTIDGKAIEELLLQMMEQGKVPKQRDLEQFRLVFAQMGDFSYQINVDKATHYVKSVRMDLSDAIRGFIGAIIDTASVTPEDRQNLNALIQKIEMVAQVDNSAFDQVKRFEIPREVIRDAVEMPKGILPDAASVGIIGGCESGEAKTAEPEIVKCT